MKIKKYTITTRVQVTDTLYDDEEESRYRIEDDDGKVIDDAQGYGYKTYRKAIKAMWYKFQGGREKLKDPEYLRERNIRLHKKAQKRLKEQYEAGSKFVFKDDKGEYYWSAS